MEEYESFLGVDADPAGEGLERSTLETRAMALVLSGAIPPYIDLVETANSIELVLGNPASLLPQKALMSG